MTTFHSTSILIESEATPWLDLSIGFESEVWPSGPEVDVMELVEVEICGDDDYECLTWRQFQARYPTASHEATLALLDLVETDRELRLDILEDYIAEGCPS